jgi:hypothetical protein
MNFRREEAGRTIQQIQDMVSHPQSCVTVRLMNGDWRRAPIKKSKLFVAFSAGSHSEKRFRRNVKPAIEHQAHQCQSSGTYHHAGRYSFAYPVKPSDLSLVRNFFAETGRSSSVRTGFLLKVAMRRMKLRFEAGIQCFRDSQVKKSASEWQEQVRSR